MRTDLLSHLECPACKGRALTIRPRLVVGEDCQEGELVCPSCDGRYPISEGIASFVRVEVLDPSQQKEMELRNQRAEQHAAASSGGLYKLDAVRSMMGHQDIEHALEAGCGSGHITPVLSGSRRVVGLDFARESLRRYIYPAGLTVDLVHGSVTSLPFADEVFDFVLYCDVIQHLPTAELRRTSLAQMARVLKPGRPVIVLAFHWRGPSEPPGRLKEGIFEGGLFYHRYDRDELAAEMESCFTVDHICGAGVQLPYSHRLTLAMPRPLALAWERLWRKTPLSLRYGTFQVLRARKKA